MITKITKAYTRHYRDNEQTMAYVEWIDQRGRNGRTEGPCCEIDGRPLGWHMEALFNRARRENVKIEHETW